jgi:hypothetical protein
MEAKIARLRRESGSVPYIVGVMIVKVQYCTCSSEFHECEDFARAERAEVMGWNLFRKLCVAYFTPDHKIVEMNA